MAALVAPTTEEMEKQAISVMEEMLIDRGYNIQYIDHELTHEHQFCVKANRNNDWLLCFINEEEKVNIAGIKDRISILNKEAANHCIIIYRSSVTSTAKKSIETLEYVFELFGLNELQLNITRHRLVPRHCRVTEEERQMLDSKYKGSLPQILTTDPVCRYYSFARGEYVRIHRKNGTIMYRVVK